MRAVGQKPLYRRKRSAASHLFRQADDLLKRRAPKAGEREHQGFQDAATEQARQELIATRELMRPVLAITGKQFVATDAGHQHCYALTRLPADQIGREGRRVGHRLIHVPDQLGQQFRRLRLDDDVGVPATKMPCSPRSYSGIIQRCFAHPVLRGE